MIRGGEPECPVMVAYVVAVEAAGTGLVLKGDWGGEGVESYGVRAGFRVVFCTLNTADAPVCAVCFFSEGGGWR